MKRRELLKGLAALPFLASSALSENYQNSLSKNKYKPNNFYLYGNAECLQYNLQLETIFRIPYFLSSQHEHKYPET